MVDENNLAEKVAKCLAKMVWPSEEKYWKNYIKQAEEVIKVIREEQIE